MFGPNPREQTKMPDCVSATGRGAHIGSAERTAIATGAPANGNTVQPEAGTAATTACVGTSEH